MWGRRGRAREGAARGAGRRSRNIPVAIYAATVVGNTYRLLFLLCGRLSVYFSESPFYFYLAFPLLVQLSFSKYVNILYLSVWVHPFTSSFFFPTIHTSIYPPPASVPLSTHQSIYLPIYLYLPIRLSIHPSFHIFVCLSIHPPSINHSLHASIPQSVPLCIHQPTHPSVRPSI